MFLPIYFLLFFLLIESQFVDYYVKGQHTFCPVDTSLCKFPLPFSNTRQFLCEDNNSCPSGYKCCTDSCFQHNICKAATYSDDAEDTKNLYEACSDDHTCTHPISYEISKQFYCANDDACPVGYKCCTDSCYTHKVCKESKKTLSQDYYTQEDNHQFSPPESKCSSSCSNCVIPNTGFYCPLCYTCCSKYYTYEACKHVTEEITSSTVLPSTTSFLSTKISEVSSSILFTTELDITKTLSTTPSTLSTTEILEASTTAKFTQSTVTVSPSLFTTTTTLSQSTPFDDSTTEAQTDFVTTTIAVSTQSETTTLNSELSTTLSTSESYITPTVTTTREEPEVPAEIVIDNSSASEIFSAEKVTSPLESQETPTSKIKLSTEGSGSDADEGTDDDDGDAFATTKAATVRPTTIVSKKTTLNIELTTEGSGSGDDDGTGDEDLDTSITAKVTTASVRPVTAATREFEKTTFKMSTEGSGIDDDDGTDDEHLDSSDTIEAVTMSAQTTTAVSKKSETTTINYIMSTTLSTNATKESHVTFAATASTKKPEIPNEIVIDNSLTSVTRLADEVTTPLISEETTNLKIELSTEGSGSGDDDGTGDEGGDSFETTEAATETVRPTTVESKITTLNIGLSTKRSGNDKDGGMGDEDLDTSKIQAATASVQPLSKESGKTTLNSEVSTILLSNVTEESHITFAVTIATKNPAVSTDIVTHDSLTSDFSSADKVTASLESEDLNHSGSGHIDDDDYDDIERSGSGDSISN